MNNKTTVFVCGALLFLQGCKGTDDFIAQPTLNVAGQAQSKVNLIAVIEALFTNNANPYQISLCDADLVTKQCKDSNNAPYATGLGGFFLPLKLEMKSIDVVAYERDSDSLSMTTTLDAPVNEIQSACGKVDGFIKATSELSAVMEFPGTYCNWMLIGNVTQSASFSIEAISLENRTFTGYYKIEFYGTGNATGSGYYNAQIIDI